MDMMLVNTKIITATVGESLRKHKLSSGYIKMYLHGAIYKLVIWDWYL